MRKRKPEVINNMTVDLPKIKTRSGKRVGRGYGSGKGGHTAGRGQKGQKSRRKVHILFEGVKMKKSFIKRLPFKRGKNKFKPGVKPVAITLSQLDSFKSGDTVDSKALVAKGFITEADYKKFGVKVLANGKLDKKLTVNLPVSKLAFKLIEKCGGKVVEIK